MRRKPQRNLNFIKNRNTENTMSHRRHHLCWGISTRWPNFKILATLITLMVAMASVVGK